MNRALAVAVALSALALCGGPAEAKVRFPEGRACHGHYGNGPAAFGIAGFFMGSRQVHPRQGNPFDTRSYQGCFRTVEACHNWQAKLSLRYPLPPYINTCTNARLR